LLIEEILGNIETLQLASTEITPNCVTCGIIRARKQLGDRDFNRDLNGFTETLEAYAINTMPQALAHDLLIDGNGCHGQL